MIVCERRRRIMNNHTDVGIRKSSFMSGILRIFAGFSKHETRKNLFMKSAVNQDEEAIRSDWCVVGNDIRWAYDKFNKEHREE